jgi:hypothetical protein
MMEWGPSHGLKEALVGAGYVLSHPSDFPEEVVNALKKLSTIEKFGEPISPEVLEAYNRRFDIEGFIITFRGKVGIVPHASEAVRKEWMERWNYEKNHQHIFC